PFDPCQSEPVPPKSQKFPDASVQLTPRVRAPGMLLGPPIPTLPYVPNWPFTFDPPTHVHCPAPYFHRSLSRPLLSAESSPAPPKSQKFPDESVQLTAPLRAPGTLLAAAVPSVPYVPGWPLTVDPPIHVHWPALNSQRSLRFPLRSVGFES